MRKRQAIPEHLASNVLAANNHTCCICRTPRKNVQIHHIDGDATNNDIENLAVVCLDCHSRVSGDEGFGRKFSAKEVTIYKKRWEAACAEHDDDGDDDDDDVDEEEEEDDEEPSETDFRDFEVGPGEHQAFTYSLDEGDLLLATVSADGPVDVLADRATVYRRWSKDEDVSIQVVEEGHYEVSISLEARRGGDHVVWVYNADEDEPARVQIDVAIWEGADDAEEEDE